MKKIDKLNKNIKVICWDLDGTLFDTEIMWFNMDNLVKEQNKSSEEICTVAYKTWDYRENAPVALKYFKENKIPQVIVNKCDLTNQAMYKNETINKSFPFDQFEEVISEKNFQEECSLEDMFKLACQKYDIKDKKEAIAICDMPFELKAAKDTGFTTIWAKNKNYPFTKDELKEIEKFSDYYVEDFRDLVK